MIYAWMSDFQENSLLTPKSSLEINQYNLGHFGGNHVTSYTKSNPPAVAIRRSKGFEIHPLIAEKRGT